MIINKAVYTKYPQLENLDKGIKESLEKDEASLKTALVLADLLKEESGYLLKVIKKYHLGVNKQQEFLKLVIEIKRRDNISPEKFVNEIEKEIAEKKLEGANRGVYLISKLREKRFPVVSVFNKKLEEKKNFLKSRGFNLVLPANLEEEGYKVEIYFTDSKDLSEKIDTLKKIIEKIEL